jgi:hypothetical protein
MSGYNIESVAFGRVCRHRGVSTWVSNKEVGYPTRIDQHPPAASAEFSASIHAPSNG